MARLSYKLGKDSRDWQVQLAQQDLLDSGPERDKVAPILYRPFDIRYTYYTGRTRGFICMPRAEVMQHMLAGDNLALTTVRQVKSSTSWQHCHVANVAIESCLVSNRTSEIGYTFPLYLYPDQKPDSSKKSKVSLGKYVPMMLFEPEAPYAGRKPNLDPALVATLEKAYGRKPTPEDIFHYIYAVLHAPAYRTKYAEFLKSDFPRIPFTSDATLFRKLAALGAKLVGLHLLKSPALDPPACRFEGEGDNRIDKDRQTGLRYDAATGRVHINATQSFGPVPEAVWGYQVGGYQVCEKWLKDRQERKLDLDDIRNYCRIVTALAGTLKLQTQIDQLYPLTEENPLELA